MGAISPRLLMLVAIIAMGLIPLGAWANEPTKHNLTRNWSDDQFAHWHYLAEEMQVQTLHHQLSKTHRPREFVVRNVNLIDGITPQARTGQSVHVKDGKIFAIGAAAKITAPDGVLVIDGSGRYLAPGLTDMHVHNLESASQHILNLANGITSMRDLDGFEFLLAMRDAINNNQMLAPTLYVSGTILNGSTFGGYARRISTEAEARSAVREQAAQGYDFIKTHNSLSAPIFLAIADEANIQGLDVVGHIPVPVSVEQAVNANMRTFEHFKGYIIDSTLTLTDEDYSAATQGAEVWNTPTFVTYRNHLRGAAAAQLLADAAQMQYVSPLSRQNWQKFVHEEADATTKLRQNIYPLSVQVFKSLRQNTDAKFLAGTDSGSYEMMPPGFMLLEELGIFEKLGMSPFEALQTATTEAAAAMRRTDAFGTIKTGARADLVLLEKNPLISTANLSSPAAVSVRGIWLDRADIDAMLAGLKTVFIQTEERMAQTEINPAQLDAFVGRAADLHAQGYVFRDHYLDLAASMFTALNRPADAARLTAMKTEADFGFSWYKF